MSTTEFDISLPSIRYVQNLIKKATPTELKLLTGEIVTGKIIWQDQYCVSLVDENTQQITVWKQAIAYVKELGVGSGDSLGFQPQEGVGSGNG